MDVLLPRLAPMKVNLGKTFDTYMGVVLSSDTEFRCYTHVATTERTHGYPSPAYPRTS